MIPYHAIIHNNARDGSHKRFGTYKFTHAKINSCATARVSGVSLEKVWKESEVDSSKATPASEELEKHEQKRDGFAHLIPGPSCSVCVGLLNFSP